MDYPHLFYYSIIARWVCSLGVFAFGILIAKKWWNRVGLKTFVLYYAMRVILLWAFCRIGNAYPMDISEWYNMSRWMVDDRLFPGIGFQTGYYLGFNGILAATTWICNEKFALIFPWMFCEIGAMTIFLRVLGSLYGAKVSKRAIILYLLSPVCLFSSWLGTQDEPMYLLFASLLTAAFVYGKRAYVSDIIAFLAVFFTKMVAPLFILPFCLLRGLRGAIGLACSILVYLIGSAALGINPFNLVFSQQSSAPGSYLSMPIHPGGVWYYFQSVPTSTQCLILSGILFAIGIAFLPMLKRNTMPDKRIVFERAILLHGLWALTLTIFFRYNFVAYLIPLAFFVMIPFARELDERHPGVFVWILVLWMATIVVKDFTLLLRDFGMISSRVVEIHSATCLFMSLAFLMAFIAKFNRSIPLRFKASVIEQCGKIQ